MKTSNLKIYILLVLIPIIIINPISLAQDSDTNEKISGILKRMPAQDNSEINTLMKEIIALGEPGLEAIIASIKPAGEGDDSQARFALGSMAYYLTNSKPGNEQYIFANTIAGALNKTNNDEVNDFYLGLLQITGINEVVPIVAEYLKNANLCDPAVRALVDIGTIDAEKALIKGLNTNNLKIQTAVVEGLGYLKSQESADKIRKLVVTDNYELKKVCLYALANIPDVKSQDIILMEAEKAEFTYNHTNATSSLLLFLKRLGETANTEEFIKLGNLIIKSCTLEKNSHTRNAALTILKTNEPEKASFIQIFNGKNLDNWVGNKTDYVVEDGAIVLYPDRGGKGNLFTEKEYSDFVFRFEFLLTPDANNGLGIRAPLKGDAAYEAMELQILDNTAEMYKDLKEYQYHGSVYGVIPAKRGFLKPVGEWNYQEVTAVGNRIKVVLNGAVILDGDIKEAAADGTIDGREHPGLFNPKGHIGFLGHGHILKFRNIWIKDLSMVH